MKNRRSEPDIDISIDLATAEVRDIAIRAKKLVRFCFRDNLEEFHGDGEGQISEAQMKALMIAVVDNVYTFLSMTSEGIAALPEPEEWQEPRLNTAIVSLSMLLRGVTL